MLLRGLQRSVRSIECEIQKPGLAAVTADKVRCFMPEKVSDIFFQWFIHAVAIDGNVIFRSSFGPGKVDVTSPEESDIFLETAFVGMELGVGSQMPLADGASGISGAR